MSKSTPTWMKVVGVLGVFAIIGVIAITALLFWLKDAAEEMLVNVETDLPAQAEEGVRFAATHSASECLQEGMNRALPCGTLELTCQLSATVFGQSCLESAPPDPTVCTGVPDAASPMAMSRWVQDRCASEGHAESSQCMGYYQTVVPTYCSLHSPSDL